MIRKTAANIETITPEQAARYLESNNQNYRNMRPTVVDRYARDMASGNWDVTGAAIVFNGDGTLLDGQHRLAACVKANTPFTTLVVKNAPTDAAITIDTGLKRSMADLLRHNGYVDVNNLASLTRYAWKAANGNVLDTETPTAHEQLLFLEQHQDLVDSNRAGNRMRHTINCKHVAGGLAHWLTAQHSPEDADAFVDLVASGANLAEDSPVLALRRWATNLDRLPQPPLMTTQAAIILKAMNAWREGRPTTVLRWRRGGASAEPFPKVWIYDGV